MVTGGLIAHPLEAAAELLRFYRDAVADAPGRADRVRRPGARAGRLRHEARGPRRLPRRHPDAAERDLAPFLAFGSPLMAEVGPMPYPVMNTLLDGGFPKGALNYWLSSFTAGLSDALIDTMVERFADRALAHDGDPARALPRRRDPRRRDRRRPSRTASPAGTSSSRPLWTDPAATDANIAWTRDTHAALRPHLPTGRWLNYLGDDQGDDAIRAAYGPNYERLLEIKRRYDPGNVFHLNHNIAP